MSNINTAEYWNKVYDTEEEWRDYPFTFECVVDEISETDRVLEYGCGVGILGKQIQDKAAYYLGMDISSSAAAKANARGVKAIPFDVLKEPCPVEDVAVALEFLEHFKDDELDLILTKISQSADKGIFAVPNNHLGNDVCKEHYQKFTKQSFKELLSKYYDDVFVVDYDENIPKIGKLPTLFAICKGGRK